MDSQVNRVDQNLSDQFHAANRSLEELEEIDHILHQMLLLSELSASDADLDRLMLQRGLECLGKKIDRIANQLEDW